MRKVAVETVDAVRRRLTVEVPEAEVRAGIEQAYEELRRKANVRGFRPGRAPRAVLEKLFGDQVRVDVFSRLVEDSYREALQSESIDPVGQPEVVTESADAAGPLRYSAVVEVRPEVAAAGYRDLDVERPLRKVSDADVDGFLERLRESFAQLEPLADRDTAAAGDVATVDYEAVMAGRTLAKAEGRLVEVAPLDPAAEVVGAHIEGSRVGAPVRYEVNYPADHANKDVAGQTVSFCVTVKALAAKRVPVLDDEFAKDHGECETLEELRRRLRERMEADAAQEADSAVRNGLMTKLVERHDFEVPRAMVERRTASMVDELMEGLGRQRPPASQEADYRAELSKRMEPRARDQVKAGFVLEAIARQEKLEVGEDQLDAEIGRAAERAGQAAERIRAFYQEPAARAALRAQILQSRALDLVVENARVVTVEKN